jgi:hypothetical protein
MLRAAVLACAFMALPAAVLAQSQIIQPQLRVLGPPTSSADGPPADYITDMAPEYNG